MQIKERLCLELSRQQVEALVIAELRKRYPGWNPLPISIDFEPRTEGGFCHCWWVTGNKPAIAGESTDKGATDSAQPAEQSDPA